MTSRNVCPPDEVALKGFFLGPQAENADYLKSQIETLINDWVEWRRSQFPNDGLAIPSSERHHPEFKKNLEIFASTLNTLSGRFKEELPKFSPRYIGHMFSELSMPAILGHILSVLHNPNNVAQESSKVGTTIEREAILTLAHMFNLPQTAMGHFTSGGTIANFESILRAKSRWLQRLSYQWSTGKTINEASYSNEDGFNTQKFKGLNDLQIAKLIEAKFAIAFEGPVLIVPENKHYSWPKAANIFGIGAKQIVQVPLDKFGCMDVKKLETVIDERIQKQQIILSVVSVLGATELGTLDPIHQIQDLLDTYQKKYAYSLWHHVDAAYGGFFACLRNSVDSRLSLNFKKSINALSRVTSITVDPHKLGYVPYASGAFLCRSANDYYISPESAPYVDFHAEQDLGLYTIEGSRSASGAVATKLTADCIGFNEMGYGKILLRAIKTCDQIESQIKKDLLPIAFVNVDRTNILCFTIRTKKSTTLSEVNNHTDQVIHFFQHTIRPDFYVSKTILKENFAELLDTFCTENAILKDSNELHVIRLTIMNPFISTKHSKINYIKEFSNYLGRAIDTVSI